jgi:hypothetical protein
VCSADAFSSRVFQKIDTTELTGVRDLREPVFCFLLQKALEFNIYLTTPQKKKKKKKGVRFYKIPVIMAFVLLFKYQITHL